MANETSQLNVVIRGKDELTPQFNQLESRLIRFVGAVTSAIAAIKISTTPITNAGNLERELANVKKTTNFTTTEIAGLNSELLKLSLRIDVSALDLAKIAAAAGQQGLGKQGVEGILAFTESVARMASVLDITAEQAAQDVGKILSIFQIPAKEVEKVVSAFNKVTNNAPAQGRQVLDIVKRIGDAAAVSGNQVGSLTNAIALAATGLELGVNPEVVGTSFVKIFAQFQTKAKEIGEIMGKAGALFNEQGEKEIDPAKFTANWSRAVAKDGLAALKAYNAVLRQMDDVAQAQLISKLQGQGRVFGLERKLARDTLDVALNKNLANAQTGYQSGLSAIQEQRTVLNTLNAQVEILKNSFFKLAADGGTPILRTLTAQVAQVAEALQSPKLQSFVAAATAAIGDLVTMVLKVGGAIGSLNVNWENFIQVLKVFLGVKIAQYFLTLTASMLTTANAARGSLLSIFTGFRASTDAATAAALASGNAARIAQAQQLQAAEREKGSIASLQKAYRDKQATAAAASAAQVRAAQAEFAANNAVARQLQAQRAERAANALVGTTGRAAADAATRVTGAVTNQAAVASAGLARVAAARQVGNAKIAAAELAHQQQLAVIQGQFQGVRTAAEKATRDGILASEAAFHTRQLAALRAADATRIAAAEATAARLNTIAAQRVIGANVNLSNVVNRTGGAASAAAGAAAAGAASAAATRQSRLLLVEAGRAKQAADAARAAAAAASSGLGLLSLGLAAVGRAFAFILRSIFPVVLILTVLYSILDATGLLEPVLKFFKGLADVLGLTSEASRIEAERQKKIREEMELTNEKIREQIDAYKELLETNGKRDKQKADIQSKALEDSTELNDRNQRAAEIVGAAAGATRTADASKSLAQNLPETQKQAEQALAEAQAKYKKLQEGLKGLESIPLELRLNLDTGVDRITPQIAALKLSLEETNRALKTAQTNLDNLSGDASGVAATKIQNDLANLKISEQQIAGLFTEQSARLFLDFGVPLRRAEEQLAKLRAEEKRLKGLPDLEGKREETSKALAANNIAIVAATSKTEDLRQKFDDLRRKLLELPSIDKVLYGNLTNSVNFVDQFLPSQMKVIEDAELILNRRRNSLIVGNAQDVFKLTGDKTGKAVIAPPSTGDRTLSEEKKNGARAAEAEARKLAKAKQELRRAELEAEAAIQKEGNDQFLRQDQRLFDLGLLALEDYYEDKDSIERTNLANEIKLQADRINSKKLERTDKALKESDRVKIDAEVVALEAQRQVLVTRLADIPAQTKIALDKAVKDFNEGLLSDKLDLAKSIGLADAGDTFTTQLELIQSQIKDRLTRFKTELAKGTPGITQTFIDTFRATQLLKVLDPVLQSIAEKAKIAAASVQASFSRIDNALKRGQLTDREAERAKNVFRAEEAKAVATQIEQSERLMQQFVKTAAEQSGLTEEAIRATDEYRRQEQGVDDLRLKYEDLSVAVDEVATSLNQSIETGLTDSLTAIMTGTTGGLKNLLKTFAADFTKTINEIVAKELSQQFVKSFLGGGGTGGIGGFFSNLFGINGDKGKTTLADKETLGRSEATPMYVKEVGKKDDKPGKPGDQNDPFAIKDGEEPRLSDVFGQSDVELGELGDLPDVSEIKASDFSDFASEAESVVGDGIDAVKDGIFDGFGDIAADADGGGLGLGGFFSSMGGALSGIFDSLSGGIGGMADGLTSVLGGLFESLVGAFSGGAGAGGAGGGTNWGSIIGTIVSFFHTGGVVGEGAAKNFVNPMVFANATRYHSGGIAGLQANEVPAILQKGEEVLTADSPRHRNNSGGKQVMAPVTMIIQTPDANSFRKSQDQIASSTGRVVNRALNRNN